MNRIVLHGCFDNVKSRERVLSFPMDVHQITVEKKVKCCQVQGTQLHYEVGFRCVWLTLCEWDILAESKEVNSVSVQCWNKLSLHKSTWLRIWWESGNRNKKLIFIQLQMITISSRCSPAGVIILSSVCFRKEERGRKNPHLSKVCWNFRNTWVHCPKLLLGVQFLMKT